MHLLVVTVLFQATLAGRLPPPPSPPPVPRDLVVREHIAQASRCVDGNPGEIDHDGRFAADMATKHLNAGPGTPAWNRAALLVSRYVTSRRREARCLRDLASFIYRRGMSSDDLQIARSSLKGMTDFWFGQAAYEANITARLIGQWSTQDEAIPQRF